MKVGTCGGAVKLNILEHAEVWEYGGHGVIEIA